MQIGDVFTIIQIRTRSMKGFLRFVGRLLFVTLLLSSAVLKIKQPTTYTTDVTNGYNTIRGLHSGVGDILPSTNTVNAHIPFPTLVRVIGAVEGLMALLIMFGDKLGGVLFFFYLTVFGIATYAPSIINAIVKQKIADLQSLLPNLALFCTLLGFSLVFMNKREHKKQAFKA